MMKISTNVYFYVMLLFTLNVSSQNLIKGNIFGNNDVISYTSVTLTSEVSKIELKVYSNDKGFYEIKTNKTGKFRLTFSALNFETQTVLIECLVLK